MPVVKLYANLRKIAGVRETEAVGDTVFLILEDLAVRFPELISKVLENGRLRTHVVVTVNGHNIGTLNGLQTQIKDADQIAIFPPIAGGKGQGE